MTVDPKRPALALAPEASLRQAEKKNLWQKLRRGLFMTHTELIDRANGARRVLADLERRSQRRTIDPATSAAAVTTIAPPTAASSMQLESLGHEPAAASIDGEAPAGWYVDPSGMPRTLRYWDGSQWTKHTAYR